MSTVGSTPVRIALHTPRGDAALLIGASLVFTGAGVACAVAGTYAGSVSTMGAGVVGAAFFGLCLYLAIRRARAREPILRVDADGITDGTPVFSAGHIPWSEIADLRLREIQGLRYLTVQLCDPRTFLARGAWWQRALRRLSYWIVGSPVAIAEASLPIAVDELLHRLEVCEPDRRAALNAARGSRASLS